MAVLETVLKMARGAHGLHGVVLDVQDLGIGPILAVLTILTMSTIRLIADVRHGLGLDIALGRALNMNVITHVLEAAVVNIAM